MAEQFPTSTPAPHELTPHAAIHAELLGNAAVRALELEAGAIIADQDATLHTRGVDKGVQEARANIATQRVVNHGNVKKLGKSMVDDGMPVWLQRAVAVDKSKNLLVKAGTTENADGTKPVSDETFANVLQWHNANWVRKNNKFERQTVAPMRARYAERINAAIAKGWITEDLIPASARRRVAETPVGLDDGMGQDPQFFGISASSAYRHSHHNGAESFIRVRSARHLTESTFTHEMTHEITGQSNEQPLPDFMPFLAGADKRSGVSAELLQGSGLGRLVERKSMLEEHSRGLELLNEAVTEHFTQALLTGNIDKVRPLRASAYRAGLMLLKTLCEDGAVPISPRHFVAAMLAGNNDNPSEYDMAKTRATFVSLKTALKQAFPGIDAAKEVATMDSFGGLTGSISLQEVIAIRKKLRQSTTAPATMAA